MKEYVDARFNDLDKAISIHNDTLERRLIDMNKFRETLGREQREFIIRSEFNLALADLQDLKEFRAGLRFVASHQAVTNATILAGLGVVIALVGVAVEVIKWLHP